MEFSLEFNMWECVFLILATSPTQPIPAQVMNEIILSNAICIVVVISVQILWMIANRCSTRGCFREFKLNYPSVTLIRNSKYYVSSSAFYLDLVFSFEIWSLDFKFRCSAQVLNLDLFVLFRMSREDPHSSNSYPFKWQQASVIEGFKEFLKTPSTGNFHRQTKSTEKPLYGIHVRFQKDNATLADAV